MRWGAQWSSCHADFVGCGSWTVNGSKIPLPPYEFSVLQPHEGNQYLQRMFSLTPQSTLLFRLQLSDLLKVILVYML